MTEQDRDQRSIVEHVLWCRDECERLKRELSQYQAGTASIGERKTGEPQTQGTATHIKYLQRTIEQLERVIAAYSAPGSL